MLINKNFLHILTICVLALTQIPGVLSGHRIVGGNTTHISRVPYLVQLWYNNRFICGGALVPGHYVITAAHCVYGKDIFGLFIVAGSSTLSQSGVTSRVRNVIIPGNYNMPPRNMDVAVLKLSRSVKGNNIKPIKLCSKEWRPGTDVKVSGWGSISESLPFSSNQLRTVTVKTLSKEKCYRTYLGFLTKSMFCAYASRKDSCKGDSGGPAVINGELCGVVSWGVGCARDRFPGVYTNVNEAKNFIERAMRKKRRPRK